MPVSPAYRPEPRHTALGGEFYDVVRPAPFPATVVRFRNQRWAERLGLGALSPAEWVEAFARFEPLPGNLPAPLALRYHGHQFRSYNPDLGDGRGFLYAQLRDPVTGRLLDLATKGSGQTPWSRFGDGRLTLKGGVREVLATEMLEALGVPTSKSFSLIETGEALQRNDEPSPTRSSVLVRLGFGHIRIGTFQRFAYHEDHANLRRLIDYVIETYHPEAASAADPVLALFEAVAVAVAETAAAWFQAGFVHGVLNTDNTMITGESFDYGPWRFLPRLDPQFTAAYFDHTGLYCFGRQPSALAWNLARFAECLLPFTSPAKLEAALATYETVLGEALARRTLARLGRQMPTDTQTAILAVSQFYGTLAATKLPFERAFFDLIGFDPARRAASPHAATWREPIFAEPLERLAGFPPLPAAESALTHNYFAGEAPQTMLIDEVEALWAPIAEGDDWSLFERTIAAIRRMGEAYAPFMASADRP